MLNGVQVVGGSNPLAPTKISSLYQGVSQTASPLLFFGLDVPAQTRLFHIRVITVSNNTEQDCRVQEGRNSSLRWSAGLRIVFQGRAETSYLSCGLMCTTGPESSTFYMSLVWGSLRLDAGATGVSMRQICGNPSQPTCNLLDCMHFMHAMHRMHGL